MRGHMRFAMPTLIVGASPELTQDDIFDALDILDVILDDLFVRHRARVKKLVTTSNKNKGPAKK